MGRLVGLHRWNADRPLGAGTDTYRPVFDLLEQVDLAAGTTEPEMFHAARGPFATSEDRLRHIEYVDSALPQVMERLAALWICAMVHHGGPRRKSQRTMLPRLYLLDYSPHCALGEVRAPDIFSALRYLNKMLLNRRRCLHKS